MTLRQRPTILRDMPAAEYHAARALSASGAWALAEECPAKFLWKSPWNPAYVAPDKPEFDIGTAAHLAVLEPQRYAESVMQIAAPNYRTGAAQEARDAARAAGLVPLLSHQAEIVGKIAGAIRAHPIASQAFVDGDAEASAFWRDPETGVPCKMRVDYVPRHHRWLVDLKSAASANPRTWIDQAYRLGYHARAAWYLDGATAAFGKTPEDYWFVVVEKEEPYLVSVITFDEQALEWGRMTNRRACELFLKAAGANDWHGYRELGASSDRAFRVSLPPWAMFRLQDRDEAGEYRRAAIEPRLLRAAERWLAPSMEEA